jgi:outer membrane scaffolding protein for murein synthesis (MipA/OmpV family)
MTLNRSRLPGPQMLARRHPHWLRGLAVALTLLGTAAAAAQTPGGAAGDEASAPVEDEPGFFAKYFDLHYWDDWHVGINLGVANRAYVNSGTVVLPYPVPTRLGDYTFTGQRLVFRNEVMMFRAVRQAGFDISLATRFDFRGYDPDRNDALAGLEERGWGLEAGVGAAWRGKSMFVEAVATQDVVGRHDGQTYELALGVPLRFVDDRLELIPHVDLVHYTDRSVDYYYGVKPGEERLPDRPAYMGRAATNIRFTTRGSFRFDNAWALSGRVRVGTLGDGITDSPIVNRNMVWSFDIAVLRRIGGNPKKQRSRD